jgi:hypothetical protein
VGNLAEVIVLARHASRNFHETERRMDATLKAGPMRRMLPSIVLVSMAFVVAELLPGSAPITQPVLWPFLLLIYGPGALLIRESVIRRHRGWESVLLLGAAYGLVEEGLALQSLFNPTLYGAADWGARILGINGVYAETTITIHAVWSAAVPILLTDLMFPGWRDRPYLGRLGLMVTGIWYILGVALLAFLARFSIAPGYQTPPTLLAVTALITLALVVVALVTLPRNGSRPNRQTDSPPPWVVLLVTGIASLIWHALLVLLSRMHPAFARWPLVLAPMLGAMAVMVMMVRLVREWGANRDWNDRHRLALVGGALLSHSLIGGAILTKTALDRAGVAVLGFVTIVLLLLFASRVRDRTRRHVGDSARAKISHVPAGASSEGPMPAGD